MKTSFPSIKITHIATLLALFVPLWVMSADAIRIAILAGEGERAPKAGMLDLLMAELSQRPGIVILEREAIEKILAEQKLNSSGLADRAQSIRLGVLLGADALLAVERLGQDQDKTRQYRVKVIEAQTGLVAGDRFFGGPAVEQKPEIMAADMDRSLAWLRIPADRRRYVAVLGYSSEQRDETLTDLPVALGALVESLLALATNVLVVDREYLRHLQTEQELTGVDRQLALSSYLIEGLVRPSATAEGRIDVQTLVHLLRHKEALPALQSQGSISNVSAIAHEISSAILRQIDADPVSTNALPAAQEAARLASHAQLLQRYGETARALPLLESSYVLDPKPGTALALAETIKALSVARVGLTHKHMKMRPMLSREDAAKLNVLPETVKQDVLVSLIRAMRLWQVEMDQRIADARGKTVPFFSDCLTSMHSLGPLWTRLLPEDPETSHLYRELRQQKEACRRREVEYVRALWPRFRYGKNRIPGSTGYYWGYVRSEVADIQRMSDDASEYVTQMKQLMTPWLEMPGYTSSYVMWGLLMQPTYRTLRDYIPSRFCSPKGVTEMIAWCDWVSSQPSLHFQMAGLYYKVLIYNKVDRPKCAAPLDELLALYPEFLARYGEDEQVTSLMRCAISDSRHTVDVKALSRKMFDAIVAHLDRRSFAEWFNANWRKAKEELKLLGEDYERKWFEAAAAKLPPANLARYRPDLYQATIDSAHEEIEQRLFEINHEGRASTQAISPYWQAYRTEPIELGTRHRPDEQLKLCKRADDRLALVWMATTGLGGAATCRVEVCDLDGQPGHSFPHFTQDAHTASNTPVELHDVVLVGDRVFVAAGSAGLLAFSRSEARLYGTSQGLPQASLIALAVAEDKLIMGFDPDYLGSFDPLSGDFEDIAYSRSLLKRNPLDGCQQRFKVCGLAADPENACVWIMTHQPRGIWRLSLPDGQISKVAEKSFETLRVEDGFVWGTWAGALIRYDPQTAHWEHLPLYGKPFYLGALHVMLGNDIISAGVGGGAVTHGNGTFSFSGKTGLFLHKRMVQEAFQLPLAADGKPVRIDFLVKTSDRTAIAGTHSGTFWHLTQPESAMAEEETVKSEERVLDAFGAAQTNRVAIKTVAASSTTSPSNDMSFGVTNLCDGHDGTCWAAATNAAQGAWIDVELERPARLSSLWLVNGWVPDEKRLSFYPINHRVRQFDVTTDAGERTVLDVADHNDPQYLPLSFQKPVHHLRFTVTEIYESEVIDLEDPPWLNISEIAFFEHREEKL